MTKSTKTNKDTRRGNRKQRGSKKIFEPYNILVLTDTKETEKNYFDGLVASLPDDIQKKIRVKVLPKVKFEELIPKAKEEQAKSIYAEIWLVFDKDLVTDNLFNNTIDSARSNKMRIGWSNPCLEIWFLAYIGGFKGFTGSVTCVKAFGSFYNSKLNREYNKNDEKIYDFLIKHGNEETAIKIARKNFIDHQLICTPPAKSNPGTTVFELIEIIRSFKST
ncbi:RloB-like protein [anaerobic digester metagenome]